MAAPTRKTANEIKAEIAAIDKVLPALERSVGGLSIYQQEKKAYEARLTSKKDEKAEAKKSYNDVITGFKKQLTAVSAVEKEAYQRLNKALIEAGLENNTKNSLRRQCEALQVELTTNIYPKEGLSAVTVNARIKSIEKIKEQLAEMKIPCVTGYLNQLQNSLATLKAYSKIAEGCDYAYGNAKSIDQLTKLRDEAAARINKVGENGKILQQQKAEKAGLEMQLSIVMDNENRERLAQEVVDKIVMDLQNDMAAQLPAEVKAKEINPIDMNSVLGQSLHSALSGLQLQSNRGNQAEIANQQQKLFLMALHVSNLMHQYYQRGGNLFGHGDNPEKQAVFQQIEEKFSQLLTQCPESHSVSEMFDKLKKFIVEEHGKDFRAALGGKQAGKILNEFLFSLKESATAIAPAPTKAESATISPLSLDSSEPSYQNPGMRGG